MMSKIWFLMPYATSYSTHPLYTAEKPIRVQVIKFLDFHNCFV